MTTWGQYRRSIQDYDAAIRLKPDYAAAYNNRGVLTSFPATAGRAAVPSSGV